MTRSKIPDMAGSDITDTAGGKTRRKTQTINCKTLCVFRKRKKKMVFSTNRMLVSIN